MAEIFQTQSNFTRGELDDRLHARTDFEGYFKGLRQASNVLVQPQGSLTRRFGTKYLADLNADAISEGGAGITDYTQVRIEGFKFDEDVFYILVMVPGRVLVYKDDALESSFAHPYSDSEIIDVRFSPTRAQGIYTPENNATGKVFLTAL